MGICTSKSQKKITRGQNKVKITYFELKITSRVIREDCIRKMWESKQEKVPLLVLENNILWNKRVNKRRS
jgi:hypothetical protein